MHVSKLILKIDRRRANAARSISTTPVIVSARYTKRESVSNASVQIMDKDEHPLLTKRVQGAFTIFGTAIGIGLTLMSVGPVILRYVGMIIALAGVASAAWIYGPELKTIRVRLHPEAIEPKPLSAELWVIVIMIPIFVIVSVFALIEQSPSSPTPISSSPDPMQKYLWEPLSQENR